MKKVTLLFVNLIMLTGLFLLMTPKVSYVLADEGCPSEYAGCGGGCTSSGQCISNRLCEVNSQNYLVLSNRKCGSYILGEVEAPAGIENYNVKVAAEGGRIGVFVFISNILRLFFIIAGLIVFANFIIAAYTYITTAGETKANTEVRERITFSVIGLVIMIAAFMVAAIIGAIVFDDATFILKPNLEQYSAT